MKAKIRNRLKSFQPIPHRNPSLHAAAVLIPFYHHSGKDYVVLTKRSHRVQHHQGQMSFPGGVLEKTDRDLLHTALRESDEEIGLKPKDVEILGQLSDFPTITHFVITPFVGWVPYPYTWRPDPIEVEEVISVPFDFFCDHRHYEMHSFEYRGKGFTAPVFRYLPPRALRKTPYEIWGASARILLELVALLK